MYSMESHDEHENKHVVFYFSSNILSVRLNSLTMYFSYEKQRRTFKDTRTVTKHMYDPVSNINTCNISVNLELNMMSLTCLLFISHQS